jgi:acetyltransferase-like isoleucine patch superfamily enzyme
MENGTWTIFGAGNLIGDIIDAVESRGETVAYIVLNMDLDEKILAKIPGSIKMIHLVDFTPSTDHYIFGFLGPNKGPFLESLKKQSLTFSNLIHKFSYIPKNVSMGEGNYIGAGAVFGTNVKMGNFNYVNRLASIGHDSTIQDFNQFGPACTNASGCRIDYRNCFYTRATIIPNIHIADDVIVGAGGVVTKNILEPGTYAGVPVRKIK